MHYAIDVIESTDRKRFISYWHHDVDRLRAKRGFRSAELFERLTDIRDAHYDFICVYTLEEKHAKSALPDPNIWHGVDIEHTACDLEIGLSSTLESDDDDDAVWLVNPFEITPEQINDVLTMWHKAKDHMVAQPGFVNARLFRSRMPDSRYGLINVARWKTAEHFMQALGDKAYDRLRNESHQYRLHPSLCKRVGYLTEKSSREMTA